MSARPLVVMFVRNTFQHDARVTKEATSLIDEGLDVVVFAVATKPEDAGESQQGPIRVIRMLLPSAVWTLIRYLGGVIAVYGKAVRLTKRLILRVRGVDTPLRTRDIPLDRLPDQPGSVEAATAFRRRLRDALTPAHRFLQGIRYARIAGERAAAMKPVAYQCHDLNSILAGFRARKIHRAPLIYDAHELWPHRNRVDARRRKTWVMERADRYFCRRVDAVITRSRP